MSHTRLVIILLVAATLASLGCNSEVRPVGPDSAPLQQSAPKILTEGVEVTVYNSNLGVVKEARTLDLADGVNNYSFEGVASQIDPTSVKLTSEDGSFEVLEQNYQYDLVSREKLLERYIGSKIRANRVYGNTKEPVEGELLSSSYSELLLAKDNGSVQAVTVSDILLPSLPGGLMTRPTLQWLISNRGAGAKKAELSYMTGGMDWSADYVLVTNKDDTRMDLNGWVTINNNAGTTFKDATLKLVAGDVNRVVEHQQTGMVRNMVYKDKEEMSQFGEQQLFEYHMYDLSRKTTLADREQKQISLLEATDAGVEKEFVFENVGGWYYSGGDNTKVQVKLNFNNSQGNGLGMPLPKGKVRVFKADSDGKLQFLGEDSIDHTPKDETVRILVGNAFDVVGERKQMKVTDLGCQYEVTWEVKLKNHKDEDIKVTALESAYWDWTITSENYPHVKESNQRIRWTLPVKANAETTLTYTIRYKTC